MNGNVAITIRGLTKRYKNGVLANDAIDLDVRQGSVFGLLGPNGAGKSTLVRQLTGALAPTAGEIRVLGVDVVREPMRAKGLMGVVPQEATPFDEVSTENHLRFFARLHGLKGAVVQQRTDELLRSLSLQEHRSKLSMHLSGGLKRKLLVGVALVAHPQLLVLDEPTTGLDPGSRRDVWAILDSLKRGGATILLTTHYMEEAELLCDEVAIIGEGRILARGIVEDIRSLCRNRFKATYEENGDRRTVYGQSQQGIVTQLEAMGIVEYGVSKTSLEDVYLELTGRALEEAELA